MALPATGQAASRCFIQQARPGWFSPNPPIPRPVRSASLAFKAGGRVFAFCFVLAMAEALKRRRAPAKLSDVEVRSYGPTRDVGGTPSHRKVRCETPASQLIDGRFVPGVRK